MASLSAVQTGRNSIAQQARGKSRKDFMLLSMRAAVHALGAGTRDHPYGIDRLEGRAQNCHVSYR